MLTNTANGADTLVIGTALQFLFFFGNAGVNQRH